jgi:monoamine oxidase
MPQRSPILVAWAGGDAVARLREKSRDPIAEALDTCAALFPKVDVRAALRAAHWHDWQGDPYSRGAYSYLRVNGGSAREALAQSVEQTLFFAGEATSGDYSGTVSGALESGEAAALAAAGAVRL